ncbi:MAG: SCO1 protein [Marinobacterium sp. xm-d-530]|nr:MAG: SCO1 protein [Marinobacterium sp. xm-d-530]
MMTNSKNILATVILILAAAVISIIYLKPNNSLQPVKLGGEFQGESIDGDVSLSDFKGKLVLLYFGYTSCPDICPTSLTTMKFALNELDDDQLAQIQPIFYSVDPERDSLQQLQIYSQFFSPLILGMTGSRQQIDNAIKQYGAYYRMVDQPDSAMGYTVDHSSKIYLIDQQGEFLGTVSHNNPNQLVEKIHSILK